MSYIDFIEKASSNPGLGSEFAKVVKSFSAEQLYAWFRKNGFFIELADCDNILNSGISKKSIAPRMPY